MAKEIGNNGLIETWAATGSVVEPSVGKIATGWQFEEQPPHEYMNWIHRTFGRQLNYLTRAGVAAWSIDTPYVVDSVSTHEGKVWIALADNTASEPTIGNTDWKWIGSNIDVALTGNPTAPTPAQFDDDTSIATTAFVQRALGNMQAIRTLTSSATIVTADAGSEIPVAGGVTATLPMLSATPVGSVFHFIASGTGNRTIQRAGSDTFSISGVGTPTSISLEDGGFVEVIRGTSNWNVKSSRASFDAGVSLSSNGYQRLPSGLIIQWGRSGNPTEGPITVTFPIAFPSVKVFEFAMPVVGSPTGWDVATSAGSTSITQTTFNRRRGNGTSTNDLANFDVYFFAAGY